MKTPSILPLIAMWLVPVWCSGTDAQAKRTPSLREVLDSPETHSVYLSGLEGAKRVKAARYFLKALRERPLPVGVRLLAESPSDQRALVAAQALFALGVLGPVTPDVIPSIIERAQDPAEHKMVRRRAIESMEGMGTKAASAALPFLLSQVREQAGRQREGIVHVDSSLLSALASVGEESPEAASELAHIASGPDSAKFSPDIRVTAVRGLGRSRADAGMVVPALRSLLKDGNERMRSMGNMAKDEYVVRQEGACARAGATCSSELQSLPAPDVSSLIRFMTQREEPVLRIGAAVCLARQGAKASMARNVLSYCAKNEAEAVVQHLCREAFEAVTAGGK